MAKLRAGDWVEVRSKEEILRTLDKNGRLDEMPFMPQMFEFSGKRFQVYKRAHKTCDTVNPVAGRRVSNTLHLATRCDGKAYGGCQAECLIFWKEAWVKPVRGPDGEPTDARDETASTPTSDVGCSEEDVRHGTRVQGTEVPQGPRYTCQATQLPQYTQPLPWWDARQYWEDYTSGNVTLSSIAEGFVYLAFWHIGLAKKRRVGIPARAIYDILQRQWGGTLFPRRVGTLKSQKAAPTANLNLQVGELVRVKSYEDVLATLGHQNLNRGLFFDAEMVPYCEKTFRVKSRVNNFIDEKTGYMRVMKTPAVILENAWCRSRYSNCRMFCPRSIYSWWREVWLERVTED